MGTRQTHEKRGLGNIRFSSHTFNVSSDYVSSTVDFETFCCCCFLFFLVYIVVLVWGKSLFFNCRFMCLCIWLCAYSRLACMCSSLCLIRFLLVPNQIEKKGKKARVCFKWFSRKTFWLSVVYVTCFIPKLKYRRERADSAMRQFSDNRIAPTLCTYIDIHMLKNWLYGASHKAE